MDLSAEAAEAAEDGAAFVVITGGEPLHHNLDLLTAALRDKTRIPIHIETSGVDILSGEPDWITLSPKRHRPPQEALLTACHELKVIVHEPADLLFADVCSSLAPQAKWLIQPGWNSFAGQQLAIQYAKSNVQWRLSVQSHKWINVR